MEIFLPNTDEFLVFLKLYAGVTLYSHGQNITFKFTLLKHTRKGKKYKLLIYVFYW